MYAAGKTVAQICDEFNAKGYKTSRGCKFNKNSFQNIFKNERYIGVYTYKDIRIEGGIPAIIDKETFKAVQIKLSETKRAPATAKSKIEYLLSTKLFCGHCNTPMIG